MDNTIIEAWARIYKGNSKNMACDAAEYLIKYKEYICQLPEQNVANITAKDLHDIAKNVKQSATGLDSFHPVDFRLLPLEAFEWIAQIFTMVEAGCQWPQDSLHIGAHLLPKDIKAIRSISLQNTTYNPCFV